MRRAAAPAIFAAILGALWPAIASANADNDAIVKFGLLGQWAMDCGAPPSPTNPYVNFSPSADGQPIRQIVTGKPKDDSVVPLSNVSLFGDNRLQLSFPQGGVTVTVILIKDQRRIRPYQSVASDGNVSVKDGIVQSGGQQTRWLNKCAG